MVCKFLDEKSSGRGIKNENMLYKELAEELHKPIIRTFEQTKVHSPFIDNTWGTNLDEMQLISKFNKIVRFLLCATNIFHKYALVIPLKHKRGNTIADAFQKILDRSNCKPNKIWVDKDLIIDQ